MNYVQISQNFEERHSSIFGLLPSNLELKNDEIHIWYVALNEPISSIRRLVQILSPDEKMRAQRFHFEQGWERFVLCRVILRTMLGGYLSVEPSRLQFSYLKNGKPVIANSLGKQSICFNVSKSDSVALFAFTRDREIGVDIELIRDIPEMNQIAERIFSVREYKLFHKLPESKRKEAFFKSWTRKEAFVKAIGNGLSYPLDMFDVSVDPGKPAELLRIRGDAREAGRWSIQDLKPGRGFAAALAATGQRWRLHCWQWLS